MSIENGAGDESGIRKVIQIHRYRETSATGWRKGNVNWEFFQEIEIIWKM